MKVVPYKLAKKKGFDENCWEWYFFKNSHVSVEISSLFFIPCKPNNNGLEEYYCNNQDYISAPYQTQLADWI